MNFIRRLREKILYFANYSFEIWWVIRGMEVIKNAKFHLNISRIVPGRPKHRDMGFEYTTITETLLSFF